ncbi:nucleotidyltransferase domain-containing protein [Cellulosimicrobium sp. 22601]|uniref:nucleotidyltransferase domain-containing protein n=1 Tax=unclassified Cellulosimicrobium TaxID=2624466 RepID=UPI003F858F52
MVSGLVDQYVTTLIPSAYDRTVVSERRAAIEKALEACALDADYVFESGSWSHGTALAGHSDVDLMAWASGLQPTRPSSALAAMKSALQGSHWAIANLRVSSPTVQVRFAGPPHFEVVPAWWQSSRGDDNIFQIPGPGDRWVESAPKPHLRFVNNQNDRLNKRVKPLARLLKQWKMHTGAPVSSFYLEMRTAEYAKSQSLILYHLDLRFLIGRLIAGGLSDMNDPTGYVSRIHAVSSEENRRTTLRLLREAKHHLDEAYEIDSRADTKTTYWLAMADVFGNDFPYPPW